MDIQLKFSPQCGSHCTLYAIFMGFAANLVENSPPPRLTNSISDRFPTRSMATVFIPPHWQTKPTFQMVNEASDMWPQIHANINQWLVNNWLTFWFKVSVRCYIELKLQRKSHLKAKGTFQFCVSAHFGISRGEIPETLCFLGHEKLKLGFVPSFCYVKMFTPQSLRISKTSTQK